MNQTIINAINNMGILSFIYKGKPRVVEPHAYGMGSDGNDLLRAYQSEVIVVPPVCLDQWMSSGYTTELLIQLK